MTPAGEASKVFRQENPNYHRDHYRADPDARRRNRTKSLEAYLGYLLSKARSRAKNRYKKPCTITLEHLKPLAVTHCPVLGIELKYGTGGHKDPATASLDRIENSQGYEPGNIVIVSHRANTLKSDATAEELMALAEFYTGRRLTLDELGLKH